MKVTFVVPCSNLTNFGARTLSSYLQARGYSTQLIFVLVEKNRFDGKIPEKGLDDLVKHASDSGLIGVSLTTNFLGYAQQITRRLRESLSHIPVAWGGIHPTMDPKRCLEDVDLVCEGEGYAALKELLDRIEWGMEDYRGIANLWVKHQGTIYSNEVRPLLSDLDEIPDPDYDLSHQFLLRGEELLPLTLPLLKDNMTKMEGKSRYSVFTSLGCVHQCPYCCGYKFKMLYGSVFRKRSLERVLQEIKWAVRELRFETVCIQDENFLVRSEKEIQEFSQWYKEEISLPFQVEFSPQVFNSKKLELLIEAGLYSVQIGVQSIDEETLKLYYRDYTRERIDEIVEFFSPYQERVQINLHFLTHNLWEKEDSIRNSIRYVEKLPSWVNVKLYPLVLYPGTPFYHRAMREGLIQDNYQDIVYKNWGIERLREGGFPMYLFYLVNYLRRFKSDRPIRNRLLGSLLTDLIHPLGVSEEELRGLSEELLREYQRKGVE